MQLHHYRRLLAARESGQPVRIRTLNGHVACGYVEAVDARIDAGDLVGELIVRTADRHAECLDLGMILVVVALETPLPSASVQSRSSLEPTKR